ncbi:MAG: hypothetical protein H0W40_06400 [Methylibium sp.]|uniref:hypothetical protein n=1 Tax=Methylibium sp. TaxID=2067992 RepID=UPI001806B08A|nr:hypothetical protein [Methylibium sp.]MBA3596992.1 hypothetical protein [Methylibium sp.]
MPSLRISTASAAARVTAAALALAAGLACWPIIGWAQAEPEPLRLTVSEPRAYGYQVGDTATREIVIELPRRLRLDEESLPAIGRHGPALELRSMRREYDANATGTRLTLWLEYQVFAAPVAARVYELPALRLRFEGTPRAEDLFVESWPVAVAPLAPEQAPQRRGLGDLQPDTAPMPRGIGPERLLIAGGATLALCLGGYLAFVYFGLPWLSARKRPFTRAYRRLRAARKAPAPVQTWQDACRAIHAAFNETAGQVVFADTVDGFIRRVPRFAPLREDIRDFFMRSQATFFQSRSGLPLAACAAGADDCADREHLAHRAHPADLRDRTERAEPAELANRADAADVVDIADVDGPSERQWLLAFARACRNAERGTA